LIGLAKRVWIPSVTVAVVAIAGFTVHRIRTFFGAEGIIVTPKVFAEDPEPFDPKVVTYEVFGDGSYANINTWTSTRSRNVWTVPPCRGRSRCRRRRPLRRPTSSRKATAVRSPAASQSMTK
jgi:hypothetical protein